MKTFLSYDEDVFKSIMDDSYFLLNKIKRLSHVVVKLDIEYYDELIKSLNDLHYNLIYMGSRNITFTISEPTILNDNQKRNFSMQIYNKFKYFDLNIALTDIIKHKEQISSLKPVLISEKSHNRLYSIQAPLIITLKEHVTKEILQKSTKFYQRFMSHLYSFKSTFLLMKRNYVVPGSKEVVVTSNINQLCETISKRSDPILPIHKVNTNLNQMYCVLVVKESDFAFYSMLEPFISRSIIYITIQ